MASIALVGACFQGVDPCHCLSVIRSVKAVELTPPRSSETNRPEPGDSVRMT